MKKILFGALVISVFSCNSEQSQIEGKIKEIVNSTFDDLKSYEFIDAKVLDTNGIQSEIAHQKKVQMACKSIIGNSNFLIKNGNQDEVFEAMKKKDINIKELKEAEQIIIDLNDFKAGKLVRVEHNYRAKDEKGVLKLQKDKIFIKVE
jgi:hypothetical protein